MNWTDSPKFQTGDRVTPIRDIIFGPKCDELCRVIRASFSRVQVEVERGDRIRTYNLDPSMIRKTSPLELLAECADDEI
jgi:hypothetical protein